MIGIIMSTEVEPEEIGPDQVVQVIAPDQVILLVVKIEKIGEDNVPIPIEEIEETEEEIDQEGIDINYFIFYYIIILYIYVMLFFLYFLLLLLFYLNTILL